MPHPAPADFSRTLAEAPAPAGTCRPAVLRLDLTAFRNHGATRIVPGPVPVVLTGPNGAGKTNVLEALSFLAPGRGLRRARLGEVDHRDMGRAWAVSAELAVRHGTMHIGTGRDGAPSGRRDGASDARPDGGDDGSERRILRIDGAAARSQQQLAEQLAVVWLTPDHDRLFADGAGVRRRFLDRLVATYDPEHVGRVAAYEHGLRERSRLLQAGHWDGRWLDALEQRLAAGGIAIVDARAHLIARLSAALADGVGPFLAPDLTAAGELEGWLDSEPALAAEDRFRDALAAARTRDSAHGGAEVGPHRSDLAARHPATGVDARQCSTGEQKAMVIAIVLAHARLIAADRGMPPLLLLDEVAAHLDADRRSALFDELSALNAQAWLTGADRALFAAFGDRAQFCAVRDGRVTPL
jgi:DNA replication and repair protein RecF